MRSSTTLRLPSSPPDDFQPSQSICEQQAGPRSVERYSDLWRRSNGIAPIGAIEVSPAEIVQPAARRKRRSARYFLGRKMGAPKIQGCGSELCNTP